LTLRVPYDREYQIVSSSKSEGGTASLKENLVLVNSFYTNSHLLGGLIGYLRERFHVHFIDLPGFALEAPPRDEISLESFVGYVAEKVAGLGLDRYILGGISFGYSVVSRLPRDERCLGVVAIFPFLGRKSLNLKRRKKIFYLLVVGFFDAFRLSSRAWRTRLLRRIAFWYSSYPPDRVRIILDHMDGRTFFAAGRLILNRKHSPCFQDCPHVLILNPEDTTIRYDYALDAFSRNVRRLFVLHTDLEHYPVEPSKEYFERRFRESDMERIVDFLRERPA
jgi:pimeloyl-ACP methyl ester carboxylesterase